MGGQRDIWQSGEHVTGRQRLVDEHVKAGMADLLPAGNRDIAGKVDTLLTQLIATAPSVERFGLPLIDRKRSYVYLTSSAVSSRPLTGGFGCQRTPFRSLKM